MASVDDAVDHLYRVPLSRFVAERRALAKQRPANAGAINALQKPTLAAWAVNQLYWTKRKTVDQVVTAAERVRDLQLRRLAGKPADLDAAERARRAAVERAMTEVANLLVRAGEQASAATRAGIRETLETLPWTTLDGRLTRALKPTGLEALAALMKGGHLPSRPPAVVVPIRHSPTSQASAESTAEKQRGARARVREEIAALERELRRAKTAERRARAAAAKAAAAVRRAEGDRAGAEAALERTTAALDARRREARDAERTVAEATRTREALDSQLAAKPRA